MDDVKPEDLFHPQADNNTDEEPEKDRFDASSHVIHVAFSIEQKTEIKELIESEMRRIKNSLEEKGFYDKVEDAKDKFEAEHDESDGSNVSGDYDIKIPLQKLIVRVLVSRAIRQTCQSDPIVLLRREGPISDDDLHTRQEKLDFFVRNTLRYEELVNAIYEHAIYEPVCITKTIDYYDEEESTTIETYSPTPEDIIRFDKDFGNMNDPESPEAKQRALLSAGQSISVPVTGNKVLYSGPKVYRVENDRFFADPNQKDFRKMRVHGEQIDYTWADVEMRSNSKKYNWDSEAVDKIKKAYGDDYRKKPMSFFEMVVMYDKNKDDHYRRYIITMESRTREIVRSVLYTNEEVAYTSHSINPKDNSWIGESLLEMINELIAVVCSNFNYMLYSNDIAHTQLIATDDPNSITRKQLDLGLVNVIAMEKGAQVTPITLTQSGSDRMAFIQMIFDLIYLLSGINVPALSGSIQARDPKAGVGKTALNQQVTNMRIEDMITKLQWADSQVMEKVEKIMSRQEKLDYWDGDKEVKVNRAVYGSPVRYIMNGSKMTFNPLMDLEAITHFLDLCSKLSPATLSIESVRRDILNIVIQDVGGSISKMRDKIMGPMDAAIKVKKAIQDAMQKKNPGQTNKGDMPIGEVSAPGAGNPSISSVAGGMPSGGDQASASAPSGGGQQ